jgi:hypothetical protein
MEQLIGPLIAFVIGVVVGYSIYKHMNWRS